MFKDSSFWISCAIHLTLGVVLVLSPLPFSGEQGQQPRIVTPQSVEPSPAPVTVNAISAQDLAALMKPYSVDEQYAQALTNQISATEEATSALTKLIELTQASVEVTEQAPSIVEQPEPIVTKPVAASHEHILAKTKRVVEKKDTEPKLTPSTFENWMEPDEPIRAERRGSASKKRPPGVEVSVDPLLIYQHQLVSHIKLFLPQGAGAVDCSVRLSLSPGGHLLSAHFNDNTYNGCEKVRQAIRRAGKLPGSRDPDVIPFLNDMELNFRHG